jgi:predicted O-methyltransferase YrrM
MNPISSDWREFAEAPCAIQQEGLIMTSTLCIDPVRSLLDRLFREAEEQDPTAFARLESLGRGPGPRRVDAQIAEILRDAYLPVSRESGIFLYQLARARPARLIVEFGMSFGVSTIYLASAVKDSGTGKVVTTEMEPTKVRRATEHLRKAGLRDHVEVREGDALQTLAGLEAIDLVLLDGWKELYLPVLKMLEPQLTPGAMVVADDLDIMREELKPYLDYVSDPASGYMTAELPLGDGLGLSVRC